METVKFYSSAVMAFMMVKDVRISGRHRFSKLQHIARVGLEEGMVKCVSLQCGREREKTGVLVKWRQSGRLLIFPSQDRYHHPDL